MEFDEFTQALISAGLTTAAEAGRAGAPTLISSPPTIITPAPIVLPKAVTRPQLYARPFGDFVRRSLLNAGWTEHPRSPGLWKSKGIATWLGSGDAFQVFHRGLRQRVNL